MRRFLSIVDRKANGAIRTGLPSRAGCSRPQGSLSRCVAAAVFVAAFPMLAEMPQWYLDKGLSTVDTDGDGIPDVWEKRTYGNPTVADSHLDRDGDGLTDLEEFWRRTDPRTFSTMGDLWSDGEKAAAGLNPLARVEPTVGLEQWLAYLGWNAQMWSGWTAQAWLALHAPDEHGFGRPYSGFVYNTLPYSEPSRSGTVDFWLKTRTDRLALATVGDRLSTNTFLVLPGERRYRIRAAKDGPVSQAIDPLPGNFADIPGATNGLWICEMSLEPAQSNLVIFPAGSPPSIPAPPSGLECLVVGDEPEEPPARSPAPRLLAGTATAGGGLPEPFHPLVGDLLRIDAVHEGLSVGGDYAGTWCLCSCAEWPTFGSLNAAGPGGVTLNGETAGPDTPLTDKNAVAGLVPAGQNVGVVTQSIASVKYPFMRQDIVFRFAVCQGGAGGVRGVESNGGDGHTPTKPPDDALPGQCNWRGCECTIGLITTVGFDHAKVNTRNLNHPEETPEEDKLYQHCLGIVWKSEPFNLTNICESFGYDLTQYVKWEVEGKLKDSHELEIGDEPEDLTPTVFRIKMVDKDNSKSVWDRIILVVNNEGTKTSFDGWYERFSKGSGTNWLAELPAMYNRLAVTTNWLGTVSLNGDPEPSATNLWAGVGTPGAFMHHRAKWEMRSRRTPGGHGHQACYDTNGVIILNGVSAGSADFSSPLWHTFRPHVHEDVDPFIRALQLDGNPCRQSGWSLDHAIIHQGGHVGKYLQCRPAIPNKKPRLNSGEVPAQ